MLISVRVFAAGAEATIESGGKILADHQKVGFKFLEVQPGSWALFAQVIVPLPNGGKATEVTGENIFFDRKMVRPGKFLLAVGGFTNTIQIREEGKTEPLNYSVRIKLSESVFSDDGCKVLDLNLRLSNPKAPLFYGSYCRRKGDKVSLTVSVPEEFEFDSATLFETAGKGERWKTYDLSATSLTVNTQILAEINFRHAQGPLKISLFRANASTPAQKEKPKSTPFMSASVGLGGVQVATKPVGKSASVMEPVSTVDAISRQFWSIFRLRGNLQYALPTGGTNFYRLTAGFGPSLGSPGRTEVALFAQYMAMGLDQEVQGYTYSLRHNQAGVDLWLRQPLGKMSALLLSAQYNAFGGISKAMGVELGLQFLTNNGRSWIPRLIYQTENTTDVGVTVDFSQALFALSYEF